MKIFLIKKNHKNDTKQLLKNLIERKYTHLLWKLFGGADLADMQLIIKFDKIFRLLCVIDIYSKYPWVIPLTLFYLGGGGGGTKMPYPLVF